MWHTLERVATRVSNSTEATTGGKEKHQERPKNSDEWSRITITKNNGNILNIQSTTPEVNFISTYLNAICIHTHTHVYILLHRYIAQYIYIYIHTNFHNIIIQSIDCIHAILTYCEKSWRGSPRRSNASAARRIPDGDNLPAKMLGDRRMMTI